MKTDVCSERGQGHGVFRRQIIAARRVARVVTTRLARVALGDQIENRIFDRAVFPGVENEIRAEAARSDSGVGAQQIFNQKAFDVVKPHVFKAVAREQNAAFAAADGAAGFRRESQTVDGWFARIRAEFVNRVAFFVNALNDAAGSPVECRAEKARDGRIALIPPKKSAARSGSNCRRLHRRLKIWD